MTMLPTGETLPEYDEGPADGPVDVLKLHAWLTEHDEVDWSNEHIGESHNRATADRADRLRIGQVLRALQAVGDATLVKNPTYRALVKQGTDIERLAAGLHKLGQAEAVLEADGDVVTAALKAIEKLLHQPVLVRIDPGDHFAVGMPGVEVYGVPDEVDVDTREAEAQAEADLQQFEAVHDQLTDPRAILANALLRIHQADEVQARRHAAPYASGKADEEHEHLVDTALVLVRVAREAAALNRDERLNADLDRWDSDDQHGADEADGPVSLDDLAWKPEHEPKTTNGRNFTADLSGLHMGRVGGREWLHVPGLGFVDITDAEENGGLSGGLFYRLSGRMVSATPDHMLGLTDGGVPVALPRAVVTETVDE